MDTSPTLSSLAAEPNALAPYYSSFKVSERLLLTGHSHQAWPDVGFAAHGQAWRDAAVYVDEKWDRAFEKWARVARGFADLLGDDDGDVTVGSNTHELVVRFLSALPLRKRPRLVTTDGEFHSIRRQLDRLAEEGVVEVVKIPAYPAEELAERMAAAVDDDTAAALVSAVLFERGHIVPGLDRVAEACRRHGSAMLVDTYHALGALPFQLADQGIEDVYVVGGGYKYLQLGEGNCFLRTPADCDLRPIFTGWFSEFAELAEEKTPGEVRYGKGSARFAGSTFDPTSQYRGAAVFDFFAAQGLTPQLLREVSQHQVALLAETFLSLDLPTEVVWLDGTTPLESRGAFLALHAAEAGTLRDALRERAVRTDVRRHILRFGPAPYLSDDQLVRSMEALAEVVRG